MSNLCPDMNFLFSNPKFTFSANLNAYNICVNFCDLEMRGIAMSILNIRLKPKRAIHNSTEVEFNCTRESKKAEKYSTYHTKSISRSTSELESKSHIANRHNTFFSSSRMGWCLFAAHSRNWVYIFWRDFTYAAAARSSLGSGGVKWHISSFCCCLFYISSRGFRVDMRRIHTFW